MPITAEQLAVRHKHLGASDIPAIFGLDPWRTPYDVWAEKTRRVEGDRGNAATDAGTRFEPVVVDWAAELLGPIDRDVEVVRADLHLCVHIDGVVRATVEPVEAKTSGLFGPLSPEWAGEFGTDEVPERVILQAHAHMLALTNGTAPEVCHVPAFLGGRGFGMFRVERNEELIEMIAEGARSFWEVYVKGDTPPPNCGPSPDVARRMRRRTGFTVPLDSAAVEHVRRWRALNEQRLTTEKAEKEAYALVLAALGDAECGDAGELGLVTYKASTSRYLDTTALREALPEVAERFTTLRTSRTLRLQKPKKG